MIFNISRFQKKKKKNQIFIVCIYNFYIKLCLVIKFDVLTTYKRNNELNIDISIYILAIYILQVCLSPFGRRDPESKTVVHFAEQAVDDVQNAREKERKRDETRDESKLSSGRSGWWEGKKENEGAREVDCAKIGRPPPSKLVGLEELCELFLPVCPP